MWNATRQPAEKVIQYALKQLMNINSWVAKSTYPWKFYLYGTQCTDQPHYGNQKKKNQNPKKVSFMWKATRQPTETVLCTLR